MRFKLFPLYSKKTLSPFPPPSSLFRSSHPSFADPLSFTFSRHHHASSSLHGPRISFFSLACGFVRHFSVSSSSSRLSEDEGRLIPVNAFFPSISVDLKGLRTQNAFNIISPTSRVSDCVILRFHIDDNLENDLQATGSEFSNESNYHYMVVFQYGSVVLFNVSEHEADGYLKIVEKYASTLLLEMTKDDYVVAEKPTLKTYMQGGLDHIMLKNLSIDGIHTIGTVLGQSIALDYYIQQIDGIVEQLRGINNEMAKTGTFRLKSKTLMQLVGEANCTMENIILKLKLFNRPEITWKNANYAQIWEYLWDDYDLTQRLGNLDIKFKIVEKDSVFFQNVLHTNKMEYLDWLVVGLLVLEVLIAIYIFNESQKKEVQNSVPRE